MLLLFCYNLLNLCVKSSFGEDSECQPKSGKVMTLPFQKDIQTVVSLAYLNDDALLCAFLQRNLNSNK